jgi:hypothetical protein
METSSGQVQITYGDDEPKVNKSAGRRVVFPGVIGSLSITSEESGRSLIQRTRSTIRSSRWSPSSDLASRTPCARTGSSNPEEMSY